MTANEGDVRPFIRFVSECTERTLDAFIAAATPAGGQQHHHEEQHLFDALSPFADESETTISAWDKADYHSPIIAGGAVGENVTVQP